MQNLKIDKKLLKDKKGSAIDVIMWVIIVFVVALFLGTWLYAHNLLTNELLEIKDPIIANATRDVVVPVNSALMQWLPTMALFIIFGSIINIFISNALIKGHPVFFVVYVFTTIVGVILSAILSNRYMEFVNSSLLDSTLTRFIGV